MSDFLRKQLIMSNSKLVYFGVIAMVFQYRVLVMHAQVLGAIFVLTKAMVLGYVLER